MGYFDKLVAFMSKRVINPVNIQALMTDTMSFIGECEQDNYYRIEFQLPSAMDLWPKLIYPKDSTTNYGVIHDFQTVPERGAARTYFIKVTFEPDTANCASMAYINSPTVAWVEFTELANPSDFLLVTNAYYYKPRDAIMLVGKT